MHENRIISFSREIKEFGKIIRKNIMSDKSGREKAGAPDCGMYFALPHDATKDSVILPLRQAAMAINRASGYKKNMNVVELSCAMPATEAKDICELAQANGFVVLALGDYKFAHEIGADGVVLNDANDLKAARAALDDDAIVGIDIQAASIEAAQSSQCDCIVTRSDKPVAGASVSISRISVNNDNCAALVRAGFDFISCWDYITECDKGALQAAVNMMYAIDLAAQAKSVN